MSLRVVRVEAGGRLRFYGVLCSRVPSKGLFLARGRPQQSPPIACIGAGVTSRFVVRLHSASGEAASVVDAW